MKKPIYLLFALFILSMVSCNSATGIVQTNAKGNTMTEDPMAKENKSLVQKKEQKINNYWGRVSLTSKKEDGRTIEEKLKNVPPKENIINTVLFDYGLDFNKIFSKDEVYFFLAEIKKTIAHDAKSIRFTITVTLAGENEDQARASNPVQIKYANNDMFTLSSPVITYAKNELIFKSTRGMFDKKNIIVMADLSLQDIIKLRSQQAGFA
ncbi:hypothetical protein [Treponema sp.]|uniref:hypothetical protein n=1 Tax=Treponema sp. TaxID=166 RepID=UPI003FA2AD33